MSQPLGYWSAYNNIATGDPNCIRCVYVNNTSFREWRDYWGKGGDFEVYSDVKLENLKKPIKVRIKKPNK